MKILTNIFVLLIKSIKVNYLKKNLMKSEMNEPKMAVIMCKI